MPVSPAQRAKRTLVQLLQTLAQQYNVVLRLTLDASDAQVLAAFKKVCRKAHPDKGGSEEHQKELNSAKDSWDEAKAASRVGRPSQGGTRGPAKEEEQRVAEWPEEI